MTPTSPASQAPRRGSRPAAKAGFTLLEMLLVLAIMGLTMAMVATGIQQAISSSADRSQVFHFERLALDLRATAYHQEQAVSVVGTGQFKDDDPDADPKPAEIKLDDGWSYSLSAPMGISGRGLCDLVTADLSYHGQPRMRLHSAADCSFTYERIG
jgi:prepilin-type N-terminal cleavage/methylation domain-containing protein